jgi:hypothetical protein
MFYCSSKQDGGSSMLLYINMDLRLSLVGCGSISIVTLSCDMLCSTVQAAATL